MKKTVLVTILTVMSLINARAQITTSNTTLCGGQTTTLYSKPTNQLTSTFASGNNHRGNMFSVTAINSIVINSVDASPMGNTTIEIYYKTGSYSGFESNSSAWVFVGSAAIVSLSPSATPIPVPINVTIPAGQTYSFYVTSTNTSVSLNYTNGTTVGAVFSADTNIQFIQGVGLEYPFTNGTGALYSPRVWNGNIHYTPLAGTTILWSTGDTTASINVSPTNATQYFVAVNSATNTDSITINVNPSYTINQTAFLCAGDGLTVGGAYQTTSGIYADTLTTLLGCDSVIVTNLTINPLITNLQTLSICNGASITVGTNTYNSNGTFTDTLTAINGCDSIVTTTLTVNQPTVSTDVKTACDSFTWINGTTYIVSNSSATLVLTNNAGCDSIITLNLTIIPSDTVTTFTLTTTTDTLCYTDSISYTGTGTLTGNGVIGHTFYASVAGIGTHTITYTLTNASNCTTFINNTLHDIVVENCLVNLRNYETIASATISPNPNNGTFSITTPNYGTYTIVNELGQTVYTFTTSASASTVNISGLASGMYIVKNTTTASAVSKIVVSN